MDPAAVGIAALSGFTGAAAMFGYLFRMLATEKLYTAGQVTELREDRDRWRESAQTVLPAVQSNTTATAEVASLVRSLDARIEQQAQARARKGGNT